MRVDYSPYLLTISSKTSHIDRFLKSLNNIDFEHISIQFRPYWNEKSAYKTYPMPYPGNLARFKYVPDNLDKNRYLVFSDTDDIIFQKDFPYIHFSNFNVFVASEGIKHKDSYWKSYCEKYDDFKELSDMDIFNAGCFAMKVSLFYDLIDYINFYFEKYYPMRVDQLIFNKWLKRQERVCSDGRVFSTLYNNIDNGNIKKENNIWYTKWGEVISCVHANGSFKDKL
jgi:hypothetical protein